VLYSPNNTVTTGYGYLRFDSSSSATNAESWLKVLNFEICHHQATSESCNDGNFSWRTDIDAGCFFTTKVSDKTLTPVVAMGMSLYATSSILKQLMKTRLFG
jgi:hypothetical protein